VVGAYDGAIETHGGLSGAGMFAVFESGGKQHRVTEGEVVRLERLTGDVGATVEFDRVLAVGHGAEIAVGRPYVEGGRVLGEVVRQDRTDKVRIIKFRRRKHYMRRGSHRQHYTDVRITGIKGS
jgi:large subunit ribosomal protein L21